MAYRTAFHLMVEPEFKKGLGAPKATKAMARYLACIIYRVFTKGQQWVDRGAEQFEQHRRARDLARLQAQAEARGFRLVPAIPQTT